MNSLRSVGRAIEFEIDRQIALLGAGERVVQETRHWDEAEAKTHGMRTKEGSSDYRYFPEPDLVPVAPTAEQRARVRGMLPELPAARRARLVADWGISDDQARVLVEVPGLADYAEAAVAVLDGGSPSDVARWCTGDLLGFLNETGSTPAVLTLPPDGLAELVGLLADGTLSRGLAQDVLAECLRVPKRPRAVVEERGLAQVSDEATLTRAVDDVLAAHPDVVAAYQAGDAKERKKKSGFLMGEAMRATDNKADPKLLIRLIRERLGG
jgi:aspartyl-tRNA(Asn)/glutamyl-tRNA(Gln) amidotransferase subunit B